MYENNFTMKKKLITVCTISPQAVCAIVLRLRIVSYNYCNLSLLAVLILVLIMSTDTCIMRAHIQLSTLGVHSNTGSAPSRQQ